jgi:hypothetical protein
VITVVESGEEHIVQAKRWFGVCVLTFVGWIPAAQAERHFPDVAPYRSLVVDLHQHTVFSDGLVWPTIRVQEAVREGLDAIAVTEHLEYQPHAADIPHPDRNRAFAIEREEAAKSDSAPLVINGSEITRSMPPGHVNAVFLEDANALLIDDPRAVFEEARRQGAFVFWNHPYWTRQRPDGIATLTDMHRTLIKDGLLHGIEVVNGASYSAEAFAIALKHDLVVIGTSDIHGLIAWDYEGRPHRTTTIVFAAERSVDALREALLAGRTVAWFDDTLIGREKHLLPLLRASIGLDGAIYRPQTSVATVTLRNASSTPFLLRSADEFTFYRNTSLIVLPARGTVEIDVKTGPRRDAFEMSFEVLNALIAPERHPKITLTARPAAQ